MALNNTKNARNAFAKVIHKELLDYHKAPTREGARAIGYLFSVLAQYFKIEADSEYKNDIAELRELIDATNTRRIA